MKVLGNVLLAAALLSANALADDAVSFLVRPLATAAAEDAENPFQAPPQGPAPPPIGLPGETEPEYKPCNAPFLDVEAGLFNDNRRTTGLVIGEGGFPPVQQTRVAGGVGNALCQDADIEVSYWYSLHDASDIAENRLVGRVIMEVMPRVLVYGGIARYDNPDNFFRTQSIYLIGGVEYPSIWGTRVSADYLRDIQENGDWLTVMVMKSHEIGRTRRGAVFHYKHGVGATATRKLPTNALTPEMNGIPSAFYRAILEIEDGPVTWYFEASPHVSFVSKATGVRDHHMLVAAGLRFRLQ